jgi:hypothetical protein
MTFDPQPVDRIAEKHELLNSPESQPARAVGRVLCATAASPGQWFFPASGMIAT